MKFPRPAGLLVAALVLPLSAAPVLEVDFSHLTPGTTIADGDRIEDVSGNGYHGFWGDASGTYPVVSTGVGTALDTTATTRGHIFHRDGLTSIPDPWDGPTTSITPYFVLNGGNSYTFEAVVNWNGATSPTNGLMGQTGTPEFWIREDGGALQYHFEDNSNQVALTDGTIDISAAKGDGQWHVIALVYDATAKEIRSYLDGALLHTHPDALIGTLGNLNSGTADIRTGAYNTTDADAFNGLQDHYRISDTALTPAQMLQAPPASEIPVATNVTISGLSTEGETLTGSYTYNDAQGDLEATSTFKWFRSVDTTLDAGDTEIAGATLTTYTLQAADVGNHMFFEVTPEAATGPTPGLAVHSSATAEIFVPGPFQRSDPFVSGTEGYHTYRIPAVLKAADGTILVFCEGRKNSSSDAGDIDIVLKRSTDDGMTWGPLILVQEEGGGASITIGNPVPILDTSNNRIHLLFCRNNDRVFHCFSDDHGLTWSTRTEITSTVKLGTWGWYATGPCHGIQLTRGNQAGRLIAPSDHRDGSSWGSHVVFSDDGGATWQIGASADSAGGVNPNENSCTELIATAPGGGSRIYFNTRDQGGSAPGARGETWSNDGGSTYDPATFANNPSFATPVVQGSTLRFRGTDLGDAGNNLIFSCPNAGSRVNMSLWQSTDESATWSSPKSIYSGPSAYSDLVRLADDRLGVLFENGDSGAYERISFYRVSEAWIDAPPPPVSDPQSSLWLFEEKAAGNLVDLTPGAILDSHPDGNALDLDADSATLAYAAGAEATATALVFDDTGGLSLDDGASGQAFDFGPDDNVTIEARVLIPSSGASLPGAIIAKNQQPGGEWWIRVQSDGTVTFLWDDSGTELTVSSTTAIDDDSWHHVAAVRDADNDELRIYIDGTLENTTPDTTTGNIANGIPLAVGAFSGTSGRNLVGSIDWIAVSTSVLAPGGFVHDRLAVDSDADALPDADEITLTGNLDDLGPGDFDGDSQHDLLELALGTDPTSAGDLPGLEVLGSATPARVFAYQRRHDIPWLVFIEEFATDLVAWGPPPAPLTGTTNTLDAPFEERVFSAPAGTLPDDLFLRVGINSVFP